MSVISLASRDLARPAVEVDRGVVGLHNAAAVRLDQKHCGIVLLEHPPVALLRFCYPVRGLGVSQFRREEHQHQQREEERQQDRIQAHPGDSLRPVAGVDIEAKQGEHPPAYRVAHRGESADPGPPGVGEGSLGEGLPGAQALDQLRAGLLVEEPGGEESGES